MSAKLDAFAKRHADKIEDVSDEAAIGNGYWIYLRNGWYGEGNYSQHCIQGDTLKELFQRFKEETHKCDCDECKRNGVRWK